MGTTAVARAGMSPPLFSVAIVTRNRRAAALRAIDSVFAQGRTDFEIVVIDNASEDGTSAAIRERYPTHAFPNVALVRMFANVGCAPGRNYAYGHCRGRYIVNLDDDGWLGEGVLNGLEPLFAQDSRIGIVAMRWAYPQPAPIEGSALSDTLTDVVEFAGGVCAFSREMLDATGGYPADYFLHGEEAYLALRALDGGWRILSAPHLLVWHPLRGGSAGVPDGHYHLCRNNLLTILRLYPFRMLATHLPLALYRAIFLAIRVRRLRPALRGIRSALAMLPATLTQRRPVQRATLRRYLNQRTFMRFQSQPLRVQIVAQAPRDTAGWIEPLAVDSRLALRVANDALWEALQMGDVLLLPGRGSRMQRLRYARLLRDARRRHVSILYRDRIQPDTDFVRALLRAAQVRVILFRDCPAPAAATVPRPD
jgi:GT2 family glycosyltransferase